MLDKLEGLMKVTKSHHQVKDLLFNHSLSSNEHGRSDETKKKKPVNPCNFIR